MNKFTALFSAITALVVFSTSTAFADDTLQCAMLKSSGQVLPPYCVQTTQPAPQATAPVAKKKSQTSSPSTAQASTTTKPHSIDVTVTLDESGTPKKIGYDTTATKMPIGKTHKPRRLAMR